MLVCVPAVLQVVARLQSLSKEELDAFEAALRAQKAAQVGGERGCALARGLHPSSSAAQ